MGSKKGSMNQKTGFLLSFGMYFFEETCFEEATSLTALTFIRT